ncbi:MAG: tetratricopeptide repeat protein [Thermoanaerobaculia bacterium]
MSARGKTQEALAESARVLDLDPVSSSSGCLRVRLLYYARQYDEAIDQYRKTQSADPTVAGFCTFAIYAYEQKGLFDEAITVARRISGASPNEMLPRAALARTYSVMGNRDEALKTLRAMEELAKQRYISEYDMAAANSGSNRARALDWLEKAYEGGPARLCAGGFGLRRVPAGPPVPGDRPENRDTAVSPSRTSGGSCGRLKRPGPPQRISR